VWQSAYDDTRDKQFADKRASVKTILRNTVTNLSSFAAQVPLLVSLRLVLPTDSTYPVVAQGKAWQRILEVAPLARPHPPCHLYLLSHLETEISALENWGQRMPVVLGLEILVGPVADSRLLALW
jgi:hypothetical protein